MSESRYQVDFGSDYLERARAGDFFLTETIKAPDSGVDSELPGTPAQATWDGERLRLALDPDSTADDTYSTVEVSSTRRFDQSILDRMLVDGSPRPMIPGRQAVFRDVAFSPHFADGRAGHEAATTGVLFQSWRNIEAGGVDFAERPEFICVAIAYIGGKGLMPMMANRSRTKRRFFASVVDFRVGALWFQALPDLDPSVAHDITLRWEYSRDVTFLVDGTDVATYEDGRVGMWPHKIFDKRMRKGVDFIGHRHLSVDPCHIDMWLNCSEMGHRPMVPNGRRFSHELWAGLSGFGVEPID